mmetsp:Transcript_14401/g.49187  ORF Transcript_14401/g.49187 Transcript_14401/m.49187 type:complete len:824 (-) Transcript_14401:36-2507(-)
MLRCVAFIPGPSDGGTGRCRLSTSSLHLLQAVPGDALAVTLEGSQMTYVCSASKQPELPDDLVLFDGCVELHRSLPSAASLNKVPLPSHTKTWSGKCLGTACVRLLARSVGIASVVRLNCDGFEEDPPPQVRVAISSALERHVLTKDAVLHVPSAGKIVVTSCVPENGAVTVLKKTRIIFEGARAGPRLSDSLLRSPGQSENEEAISFSSPVVSTPVQERSAQKSAMMTRAEVKKAIADASIDLPFSPHSPLVSRSLSGLQLTSNTAKVEHEFFGSPQVVSQLRDMCSMIFHQRDKVETMGIRPSSGILVIGAKGTGKSVLVKSLSLEFAAQLFTVRPHQVYRGAAGEGEELIREVFWNALKAGRAIIHFKDIDVLCPSRAQGRDKEARTVAQLLSLMDGVDAKTSRKMLLIVGSTGNPDAIDIALRRPGRFDSEVALEAPDVQERLVLLEKFVGSMQLHPSVSTRELAKMTVGYVGANLKSLCSQAAGNCILRHASEGDIHTGSHAVMHSDFLDAMRQISIPVHRDFQIQVTSTDESQSMSSLGGMEGVKEALRRAIEWPLTKAESFRRMNVRPSRGVLLYGVPGCGKTSLVRSLAGLVGLGFVKASGSELFSAYLGESEAILRQLFRRARRMKPCILFLDEIDAIVGKRSLDGSGDGTEANGVQQRVLSTLLNEMDGVDSSGGVVVVGATNRLDMIDAALLRPGRFDVVLEVPVPDSHERQEILATCSRRLPISADVDLKTMSDKTEGYTGAEINRLVVEAAMVCLRENMENELVSHSHFLEALRRVRPALLTGAFDSYTTAGRETMRGKGQEERERAGGL